MTDIRKLSLTLSILIVTLMLVITTLVMVLVSGTQGVVTNLDIHYTPPGGGIDFLISGECINANDFKSLSLDYSQPVREEDIPVPGILNKTFLGWYKDSNLNQKVTFPTTLAEGDQLYPAYKDAWTDLLFEYDTTTQSYAVTGSNDELLGLVAIPDYYSGSNGVAKVTIMRSGALKKSYGSEETAIVLSNNLTTIESEGVTNCTIASWGTNISSITANSFENCQFRCNIVFSNNITTIPTKAFGSCVFNGNITISSSITNIQVDAFDSPTINGGVIFEVTTGWKMSLAGTEMDADVSDPATNAYNIYRNFDTCSYTRS